MRTLCLSLFRSLFSFVCALGAMILAACGGGSSNAPANAPPVTAAAHHPDHHPGPASMAGHPGPAGHADHKGHADHADHAGHAGHKGHAGHDQASHAGGMTHDFKGAEEWSKVFDDPARDQWQRPDEVAALLQIKPGMTVADVGAGTGYFIGRLAAAAGDKGQVIATDLEPDMVRFLEERARREGWKNVRAVQVSAEDPGLAAAAVDRILVVDVWHHLGERRAYAAKLAASLRPGGRIAVVDFTLDARRGPPAKHRLPPAAIMEDLRAAGLVAELATESLPDQYVVIGTKPSR